MTDLGIGIVMIVICGLVMCCCCECISELCYDGIEPDIDIPVVNPINSI